MGKPSEFEIIQREFIDAGFPGASELLLGPGDDCAIIRPPAGEELCLSIDTLVNGVHFPAGSPAALVASRALTTSLSDLAAMGASPLVFTLSLTIPEYRAAWMKEFADSLRKCSTRYAIALAGGDLTRGPLSVTVQVVGSVPAGKALRRSGAVTGDDIYVSGTVGDAWLGLKICAGEIAAAGDDGSYLRDRFAAPEVRIDLGRALRGVASAAIDVSDGLVQDLGHIAEMSGVGATVDMERLPISEPLERIVGRDGANRAALAGGDDYELCFTAPRSRGESISRIAASTGVRLTRIGRVVSESGVRCVDRTGNAIESPQTGYLHF